MQKKQKRSLKIKIIIALSTALSLFTIAYIFIPKLINNHSKKLSTPSTFQLSHPDNRPDQINGKTIILKRLQPTHFKEFWQKINYPEVLSPLYPGSSTKKIPLSRTILNLKSSLKKEAKGKTLLYLIFNKRNNDLIGAVDIREPNPKDPGQFGCWITPKYWGRGILQEAFKLISTLYFKLKPNVLKFNAEVKMKNLRGYFALKKCGFKLIQTMKKKGESIYLLEYYNPNKKNNNFNH